MGGGLGHVCRAGGLGGCHIRDMLYVVKCMCVNFFIYLLGIYITIGTVNILI